MREAATMLVTRRYRELESMTGGVRLSAEELARAVEDYPANLVVPPSGQEPALDIVQHRAAIPRTWSVDVPLWSQEEGRSDLTLQLTVRERANGTCAVEVDDLHVH